MTLLEQIKQELQNSQNAHKLLEKIWFEYGPYGHGEISNETRYAMQDYFKFDDSE